MQIIKAEIITIGDEILYGQITDTNSQWIGEQLHLLGIKLVRKTSVGDVAEEILQALKEAEERAQLILITGGLGPTKDDITKKTLCTYFNTSLTLHDQALEALKAFFALKGKEVTGLNQNQALLPQNCTYIPNTCGTAPGMWFEKQQRVFVSMPGVPFEMKEMMQRELLPAFQKHFQRPTIEHKIIKTSGIGESMLAELIASWEEALPEHIKLAYLPSPGEVKLRLTGTGDQKDILTQSLNSEVEKLKTLAGKYIYGFEQDSLESVLGQLLKERGYKISVAESCTGGFLGHRLTSIPGSSAYFAGGVLAYSNEIKEKILGVKREILDNHGAVSEETVRAMAIGAQKLLQTETSLAISGIAGPDGGTPQKPIGTVCIAYAGPGTLFSKTFQFTTLRAVNIQMATYAALNMARMQLIENSSEPH